MKRLSALILAFLLIAGAAHAAGLFGVLSSGSKQTTTGFAPVVTANACGVSTPVVNGSNVTLSSGPGTCSYTATCNSVACTGTDVITLWAITTQSTANSFSIVSGSGILQGGSAASSVTAGSYTVTVTATNAHGTSPGVVQTVTVTTPSGFAPVVTAVPNGNSIVSPFTTGSNVVQTHGAGNLTYVATCNGGACSSGNAITSWTITAQSCPGCYAVTSGGVIQGGANAITVGTRSDTITVTATNSTGTSPGVVQTINAYADGSVGATTCSSPQYPSMLSGEAATPPWNVAGVNYCVGAGSGLTTYTGQTISGWTFDGTNLTSTTNGATLSNYDFSGVSNFQLRIVNSNVTVNNIKATVSVIGGGAQEPIAVYNNATGITISNSSINCNFANFNSSATCVNFNGDVVTFKYNYVYNSCAQLLSEGTGALLFQYDLLENVNSCATAGVHGDVWENATNTYNGMTVSFVTAYQHNNGGSQYANVGGSQGYDYSNGPTGSGDTGITYNNNVVMTSGTQPANIDLFVRPGNTTGYSLTITQNYVDLTTSGTYSGPSFIASSSHGGTGTVTCSGNINMATGGAETGGC